MNEMAPTPRVNVCRFTQTARHQFHTNFHVYCSNLRRLVRNGNQNYHEHGNVSEYVTCTSNDVVRHCTGLYSETNYADTKFTDYALSATNLAVAVNSPCELIECTWLIVNGCNTTEDERCRR